MSLHNSQVRAYTIFKKKLTQYSNTSLPNIQIGAYTIYKSELTQYTNQS